MQTSEIPQPTSIAPSIEVQLDRPPRVAEGLFARVESELARAIDRLAPARPT